jgi:hypothetical protein
VVWVAAHDGREGAFTLRQVSFERKENTALRW